MIVKAPDERFPTAPEGTFAAVCVDEIDMGIVTMNYNGEETKRPTVRLVWQLDEDDDKGNPYFIKQDYRTSLHEKAALRKHLQSWRGRAFTAQELLGFDLEQIVGAGCLLSIVHSTGRRGGTFANVEAIMKLPRGSVAPAVRGYVRIKDRKVEEPKADRRQAPEEQPPDFADIPYGISDDDVPF